MSLTLIRKSHSFSAVPDALFKLELSPIAFKVIAWALGRPDGWQFYIGHMLGELRLTEKLWKRAKQELVEAGFFTQKRCFGERNQIYWQNIFTDAPLWESPEASIPPAGKDGSGTDAGAMDAQEVDKAEDWGSKVSKAAAGSSNTPTPKSRLKKHPTQKVHIIIKNQRDHNLVADMAAKHGMDQLEETARLVLAEGLQPFPSNIAKKLGFPTHPRKQNGRVGEATTPKPWFLSVTGIEKKAAELGINGDIDASGRRLRTESERYECIKVRTFRACEITDEMIRKARIDFPN